MENNSRQEKCEMDIIYEEYLNRDDIIVEIDDRVYYRIIHKDKLSVRGGIILVMIPCKLFEGARIDCRVVDENEKILEIGGPVHYAFRRKIPEWYVDAFTVDVKGIKEIDEIGDYLALYK